jgi:hypothetical protein
VAACIPSSAPGSHLLHPVAVCTTSKPLSSTALTQKRATSFTSKVSDTSYCHSDAKSQDYFTALLSGHPALAGLVQMLSAYLDSWLRTNRFPSNIVLPFSEERMKARTAQTFEQCSRGFGSKSIAGYTVVTNLLAAARTGQATGEPLHKMFLQIMEPCDGDHRIYLQQLLFNFDRMVWVLNMEELYVQSQIDVWTMDPKSSVAKILEDVSIILMFSTQTLVSPGLCLRRKSRSFRCKTLSSRPLTCTICQC